MAISGKNRRGLIGLWVLAALFVVGYNGVSLTTLLEKPLPSLSAEARATIAKWQRLENQAAARLKEIMDPGEIRKIVANIDFKKTTAAPEAPKRAQVPATVRKPAPEPGKAVALPVLNGIVAVYGADGEVAYLAVIDGKTRKEKNRIGDFVLEKIEAGGVVLARGKRSWFVPAPTVHFSMDTSDATHKAVAD
jgi:DNA-binding Lrp family transcriptional regulator